MMTYTIKYQKKVGTRGNLEITVRRYLTGATNGHGWMLKDDNHKDIRPFNNVAEAMTWIDEERRGV